ncbi:MAG: trehalose-6-phosphate synthase, partial [Candidatus Acidiferrales bacterium]
MKFLIGLVLSLALLTWATAVFVQRTTKRWYENDVRLRAELVVSGAHDALSNNWNREDRRELERTLAEIAEDQRIMAAAACTTNFTMLARTAGFPMVFSCEVLGNYVKHSSPSAPDEWQAWHESTTLPGGSVMVSAIPLEDAGQPLGFIILIHDLSYAERREIETRRFVLLTFGFLALAAAAVTVIV